jgi:hypothetical protein
MPVIRTILFLVALLFACIHAISAGPDVMPDSTNLPLIVIETHGAEITDDPKIMVDMKIIAHENGWNRPGDAGNIYTGKAGIEYRGAFSQMLPQKPYGFETRDASGNNLNVSLLGMPAENDWILLANYNDKVFMRNTLAFSLFEQMGHYAPRTRLCEVIVNSEYMGIFVLTEKIKHDKGRVDIAKLDRDDNGGDSLTGGYIFAVDYYDNFNSWTSNYQAYGRQGEEVRFVYKYPEPGEITLMQKDYIRWFVNSLESHLYGNSFMDPVTGYAAYLDVDAFIDYFIVGEVSRNVDAYKKSCFYHKNRNDKGGLLQAGPVWDFDWAWKNLWDNCYIWETTDGANWAYKVNECDNWPVVPSWIERMMEDPAFRHTLHERYFSLRQDILSDAAFTHYIDSVELLVDKAQQRHYQRWQILGEYAGAPEMDPPAGSFAGEIERFRNWISLRLAWLDAHMPDAGDTGVENEAGTAEAKVRLFPNPVKDLCFIESVSRINQISILNAQGQIVRTINTAGEYSVPLHLGGVPPGLYVARVIMDGDQMVLIKLVITR